MRFQRRLNIKLMKRNITIVCLFLWLVGLTAFSQAKEESLISVESQVDRATITIGDRILYTLKITTDPKVKLEPLRLGSNLGSFEVKDYKIYDPVKTKDGRMVNKSEYVITTFTTGDYVIPDLAINYTDPSGEKKQTHSEPLFILVKSVGATESDKEDIRDLKPSIDVKGSYLGYLLLIPALALLGTGGFLYYRHKAKGLAFPRLPDELQKPAWEVALFELDSLKSSDLLKKKQVKRYFIFLSDIVRKYVERRFEIPALDRTTEEIRGEIKKAKLDQKASGLINELLSFCDLVKFAKYIPSVEEIEKSTNDAYDIVNLTKVEEVKQEVAV
ncbi:MAG TPA: BatD family protein [candidate division Zixibacteria bacterium]